MYLATTAGIRFWHQSAYQQPHSDAERSKRSFNSPATQNLEFTAINFFLGTDADGFYKVLIADHVGDTRGNEWHTDMIAISLDSTQLPMKVLGIGIPP